MNWRFTIIDRDNVSHVIDEPIGWDATEITIKRDDNTHGIMFDFQNADLKYYGNAYNLLKTEYDTYGSQGNLILVIEQSCNEELTELYRGKFLFGKYDSNSGAECFVKMPIENTGDVIDLTTKWDQKVNLATTVAFDGTTALTPYDKLGFDLSLPSKGIFLQDYSKVVGTVTEKFAGSTIDALNSGHNVAYHHIQLGFNKEVASEFGLYSFNPSHILTLVKESGQDPPIYNGILSPINHIVGTNPYGCNLWPLHLDVALNYGEGSPNFGVIGNPCKFEFALNGRLTVDESHIGNVCIHFLRLPERKTYLTNGEHESDYEYLYEFTIIARTGTSFPSDYYSGILDIALEESFDIIVNKGDRFYFFISVEELKSAANITAVLGGANAFEFYLNDDNVHGSYFKISNLSKTNSSKTKAFLINESISRIAEAITNDKMRAYSDYFGRIDSQPYATSEKGVGSYEALAKGIYIRNQQNRIAGQPNIFSMSMKDMFEGIEPIHHIGFGIEDDPEREGYKRLRVEHWKHFYTDDLILSCMGVNNVERKIVETKHHSTFQFGYDKYEAEEYNGLDEFLTKRTFRTTLNGLTNQLVKSSKFIASGYAWEITRRKNDDSSDWRFDNDTFIICLKDFEILKEGTTTIIFTNSEPTYQIQLTDASMVGLTALAVGDKIIISNSISNNGTYTILAVEYDGTSIISGGYAISVQVAESVVDETLEDGDYVIERKGYLVETGNVDSPSNIIDPDTLYNYRISPIRNAMRWMDTIAQGYKTAPTLIFTDGLGNYQAAGKMTDSFGRLEADVIAENETITSDSFADTEIISPLLAPEQIIYDFPLSIADFKAIKANPYGKIYWNNGHEDGYGYIETLKYKPEEGIANFILIPKL